jgi:hypothetical protein
MEVEKLSAQLAQAKQRLKELEKRDKKGAPEAGKWEGKTLRYALKKPDGKVETRTDSVYAGPKYAPEGKGGDDPQRRLDRLEQKMDKLDELLNELREMRKDRGDKGDRKDGPTGPVTN